MWGSEGKCEQVFGWRESKITQGSTLSAKVVERAHTAPPETTNSAERPTNHTSDRISYRATDHPPLDKSTLLHFAVKRNRKMSRSPIAMMIDRSVYCTRCGAPMGKCDCWVKITLRCSRCARTKQVAKDPSDPPGTAIVESLCDRCEDGGNKPETLYYNAQGFQFDGDGFNIAAKKSTRVL